MDKTGMNKLAQSGILYLYIAFVAELFLLIYFRNDAGYILSPLLMIATGLFLSYYPLKCKIANNLIEAEGAAKQIKLPGRKIFWGISLGLALVYIIWSVFLFNQQPINVQQSDILPFIKSVYLERLANGEPVYDLYTGFQYGTFRPSYLPAHWMPYILPYLLGLDLRWACVALFIAASLIFTKQVIRQNNTVGGLVAIALPYLLVFSIYLKQSKDAAHTIEIMVMGYYLVLAVSLFSNNAFTRALGVCLPLLSRYAMLFWLPVYAVIRLIENPKKALVMAACGILIMAFIFVPFLMQTPDMFKDFNGNYLNGVISEWRGQSWQKPGDKPFQLYQGMGFASWYYEFGRGDLQDKIIAIKDTLIWVSLAVLVVQFIQVYVKRKMGNHNLVALLTLKAALTLFYPFVMIPYVYLNWVPLMVSIAILSRITFTVKSSSNENIYSQSGIQSRTDC